MKNILAENMLRFGVKNLTESQINDIKLMMEQAAPLPALPPIVGLESLAKDQITAPIYNYFAKAIKNYGIQFSPSIASNAAAYMTVGYIAKKAYRGANVIKRAGKRSITQVIRQSRGQRGGGAAAERLVVPEIDTVDTLQLNLAPGSVGRILTVGRVSAEGGPDSNNPGESSSYTELQQYMNDSNLKMYLATGKTSYVDSDYFIEGDPKAGGGAGSLDLVNNPFSQTDNSGMVFYGRKSFKAASGQTTATTTTTTTFTPGPEIVPDIKGMFVTGKIQLAPGKAEEISAAVKDAQKLGKIVKMRIESSASHGRGTNMSRDAFADMVGVPVDQVPPNPSVNNKSDNVTDPMEGGNAFLAIKRAQVAAAAVKAAGGGTPSIQAKIQGTGNESQYVRLFITVKKPDNTTTITKDDLANIGQAEQQANVRGKAQMIMVDLN